MRVLRIESNTEDVAELLVSLVSNGIPFIQLNCYRRKRGSRPTVKHWTEDQYISVCYIKVRDCDVSLFVLLSTIPKVTDYTVWWREEYRQNWVDIRNLEKY